MENLISVIVCTYNQEDTIARTLDSVLAQRCHVPFEIVIGEDCSTDGTLAVCQTYEKQHPDIIRIIANKHNKGIVDNYFNCIEACRGEYIADCAGDDFWIDPLKLEKEVCIMEQHPNVTLVHTDWVYYNETTKMTRSKADKKFTNPFTEGRLMLEHIITQTGTPIIHLCTALYRADVIRRSLALSPQLRNKDFGCEDLQICFEMAKNGTIAYLPDITLNYSECDYHDTVSRSRQDERQFRFVKQVTDLGHYLACENHLSSSLLRHYFSYRLFALSMHAFRSHQAALRQEVLNCQKQWEAEMDMKTRIVLAITNHSLTWQWALAARHFFVILKQLIRR